MKEFIIKKFLKKYISEEHYMCLQQSYDEIITFLFKKDMKNLHGYFLKRKKDCEKYYVIRMRSGIEILAAWRMNLLTYNWAVNKGYIPLIDIEPVFCYHDKKKLGEMNIWDDVFEQPILVKDIYKKGWVYVAAEGSRPSNPSVCTELNGNPTDDMIYIKRKDWRTYYGKIFEMSRKFCIFKREIIQEFEEKYGEFFDSGVQVLGVCLREEFSKDWLTHMPENSKAKEIYDKHPLNLSVRETIDIVKKYKEKWGCSKIFLSTYYCESIELFEKEFGIGNIVYVERLRKKFNEHIGYVIKTRAYDEKEWAEEIEKKRGENKRKNITYVQEIIGLSKCTCLIGASCSGTIAALGFNGGKYKDIYLLPDSNQAEYY